jgi:hypothetical protein
MVAPGPTRSGPKRPHNAFDGRRFESIEQQNEWLAHWEERWAAPRIHGRKERQVLAMYLEEKPYLRPLPLESFRYFRQETRTVDDSGPLPVDASHYAARSPRRFTTGGLRWPSSPC